MGKGDELRSMQMYRGRWTLEVGDVVQKDVILRISDTSEYRDSAPIFRLSQGVASKPYPCRSIELNQHGIN